MRFFRGGSGPGPKPLNEDPESNVSHFNLGSDIAVGFVGSSVALDQARWLLRGLGARIVELPAGDAHGDMPVMMSGSAAAEADDGAPAAALTVRLWDFHVRRRGSGVQACAVSGVSWVIGLPGRAPLYLQASIPEKWCGTLGASAALSFYVERLTLPGVKAPARVFDVSAAEILRCFADQNFGNHKQIPTSWRRNGRISPEHGGIYPQGFFKCRDGHVGVIGRSRQDWAKMLAALGNPAWATDAMRNPFDLARDSTQVDVLFEAELQKHSREELLALALKFGATFAPIYNQAEIRGEHLVRESFFDGAGMPGLPFEILPAT